MPDNRELRPEALRDLFEQVKGMNVLLLVHGFNNPIDDVLAEYVALLRQCKRYFEEAYDYIIGYLWPGGDSRIDYFLAKQHTERAGIRLRRWLHAFSEAGCTVDIMGHSMAALVGYHALKTQKAISIRNVFSFGAAISRDRLNEEKNLYKLVDKVSNLYVFHTRNDGILKYAFRMVEWRDALGFSGPSNRDYLFQRIAKMTVIDCSEVIDDHTGYKQSDELFRFISQILDGRKFRQFVRLKPDIKKVHEQMLKPAFH